MGNAFVLLQMERDDLILGVQNMKILPLHCFTKVSLPSTSIYDSNCVVDIMSQ